MIKKGLWLMLVVALVAGVLAGCNTTPSTAPPAPTQPKAPKILNLALAKEASTANTHLASLDSETTLAGQITGTLYSWQPLADRSGAILVPEYAAGEPKNPSGDGKVWTIELKKDAKWENGDPINADSWIYSWKMILDPKMLNAQASSFSTNFVEIDKAMAYFKQASSNPKVTIPWEEVGLKKIDDYTLEIRLASDYTVAELMRQFSMSRSGLVYQKMYEQFMNADRTATQYASNGEKLLSSGPFKMVKWVQGAETVFEKNPNWPLADKLKLDGIRYRVVEDAGTRVQLFEKGELDYVGLGTEGINTYAEDPRLLPGDSRYIRLLEINQTHPDQPIFKNANFRKAIYYAIDRNTIAKLGNKIAAPYIVPTTSIALSDGTSFRKLAESAGYMPKNGGYDPELAKKYFDKALAETGQTKVSFVLNYTTTVDDHVLIGEFLQESLPKIFGADRIKIELAGLPSAQNLDNLKASPTKPTAYQMSMSQWSLAATDFSPNKVFEVYTSSYSRKNGPYNSTKLDALYKQSISDAVRKDEKQVANLAMEMEKVFLDEVIAVPVIQTVGYGLASERLKYPLDQEHVSAGWCTIYSDLVAK